MQFWFGCSREFFLWKKKVLKEMRTNYRKYFQHIIPENLLFNKIWFDLWENVVVLTVFAFLFDFWLKSWFYFLPLGDGWWLASLLLLHCCRLARTSPHISASDCQENWDKTYENTCKYGRKYGCNYRHKYRYTVTSYMHICFPLPTKTGTYSINLHYICG